jgi:transposase
MSTTERREPANWREGRRLRAWELSQQGWQQQRIAEALGVSAGAVSQWLKRARAGGGAAALYHRKPPGKRCRLTPEQQAKAVACLARGATAFGFVGERWTQARVREVLRREFGVLYHPSHVSRLLATWGWSRQRPQRRARQRDEAAIQQWREEQYPALQKRGRSKAAP